MVKQKETKQKEAKQKNIDTSKVPVSYGTGRRKCSVARVWLRRGKGNMLINGKPYIEYFDTETSRLDASMPFRVVQEASNYDISVNVYGGGKRSQADAVKLGFSRALVAMYENHRSTLRSHGLLTVDSRIKERKKYGQKGARRKFQFVKR